MLLHNSRTGLSIYQLMLRTPSRLLGVLLFLARTIHLICIYRFGFSRFRAYPLRSQPLGMEVHSLSNANDDNNAVQQEERNYLAEYLKNINKEITSARIVPREAVPPDALIVKSLLWTYQKQFPVLVVLSLSDTVDKPKLAKHLQVSGSSKQMRMAAPSLVLDVTGQTVGNVSPVGHKQSVRTIVDEALINRYNIDLSTPWDASCLQAGAEGTVTNDVVCYGGGGSNGMELKISLKELLYRANAEVGPVSSDPAVDQSAKVSPASAGPSGKESPVSPASPQDAHTNTQPTAAQEKPSTPASTVGSADPANQVPHVSHISSPVKSQDDVGTAAAAKRIRDLAIDKNSTAALSDLLASLSSRSNDPQELKNIIDQGTAASGKTALHLAAWKGSIESVSALIAHGADVNTWSVGAGNYGKTALFYAITQCRDDVVLELLRHGANVKIVNNKGQTPLSLGPSHLAEDTILAIEKAEKSQPGEWLNFYTTNYCNTNTCFGDLDPRFHELGLELRFSLSGASTAQTAGLPRSINATTFEFRRNHFKSYSKANHMIDELVVALMSCPNGANVRDALFENENVEDAMVNGVLDIAPSSTLVGYVTAVHNPSTDTITASIVPIAEYWRGVPETENAASVGENATSWYLRSAEGVVTKEAVSAQLLVSETGSNALPPAVAKEFARSLRVGQLVLAKGAGTQRAEDKAVDFAVRQLVSFGTLSNSPVTPAVLASPAPAELNDALAGPDQVIASSQSALVSQGLVSRDEPAEFVTLADVVDSFYPTSDANSPVQGVSAGANAAPFAIPIIVVNDWASVLALESDVAEMVSLADTNHAADAAALSAEHHTHPALSNNKLHTVVAIDCEWWSGQDYNSLRKARDEAKLSPQPDGTPPGDASLPDTKAGPGTASAAVATAAITNAAAMALVDGLDAEGDRDAEVDAPVAIMQLGTRRAAYLIDLQTLAATFPNNITADAVADIDGLQDPQQQQEQDRRLLRDRLNTVLQSIFRNKNILKLGFKVAPDFEKVCASYPAMSCFQRINGLMDTHTMTQQLVPALIKAKKLPAHWHSGVKLKQVGLSKLCQLVMGKALDKTMQCSTWHMRPLSPEQTVYAALDVATVIRIFDFFTALDFPAVDGAAPLTAPDLRKHKLYRVFTSNLKFFLPSLSADTRVTSTPLRTLHGLLLDHWDSQQRSLSLRSRSRSRSNSGSGAGITAGASTGTGIGGALGPGKSKISNNRGSAACKRIVSLDMVVQSWTAQQEEPIDYERQLSALLESGLTVADLAAVTMAEATQREQQQRFKGRLSGMYSISAPVTAFLQGYRSGAHQDSASLPDTSYAPALPFLGQYISQSKEACVEFCQALLRLQRPATAGSSVVRIPAAVSAPTGIVQDSAAAAGKKLGGLVLLNDTLVLFLHCAAARHTGTLSSNSGGKASKNALKSEANAFMDSGRYFTWSIEPSAVIKDNSPRASKIRSLLLQSLITEDTPASSGDDGAANAAANTPAATDPSVLLFVRQNAAPYVFCGRCSVASLQTQLGAACTIAAVPAVTTANGGASSSTAAPETAVTVLFEVTDYSQLVKPGESVDKQTSLYADMIAQHTGVTFKK